jgi:hypothetical protein
MAGGGGTMRVNGRSALPIALIGLLVVIMYLLPTVGGFPTWPGAGTYSGLQAHPHTADLMTFERGYRPIRAFISHELAEGRLPLWLPTQMLGIPLLEQVEYQLLNPLEWLNWIGSDVWWSVVLCLYLIVAGAGMFRLASQVSSDRWAAAGGAIAYVIAGFTPWFYTTTSFVTIVPVIPWLLYFLCRAIEGPASCSVFLGLWTTLTLTFLSGQPQIAFCTLYFGAFFIACLAAVSFRRTRDSRMLVRALSLAGIALALALLAASPQIVRTAQLLLSGETVSNHPLDRGDTWQLTSVNFLNLFFPHSVGVQPYDVWTNLPAVRQSPAEGFPIGLYATGGFLALAGLLAAARSRIAVLRVTAFTAVFLVGTLLLQSFTNLNVWPFYFVNLPRYCTPFLAAIGGVLISAGLDAIGHRATRAIVAAAAIIATLAAILVIAFAWQVGAKDVASYEMLWHCVLLNAVSLTTLAMIVVLYFSAEAAPVAPAAVLLLVADASFQFSYGFDLNMDAIRLVPFACVAIGAVLTTFKRSSVPMVVTAISLVAAFWGWHAATQAHRYPYYGPDHYARLARLFEGHRVATNFGEVTANVGSGWNITTFSARMPLQSSVMLNYLKMVALMPKDLGILDFRGISPSNDISNGELRWSDFCTNRAAYNLLAIDILADRGGGLAELLARNPACLDGLVEMTPEDVSDKSAVYRDTKSVPLANMIHACEAMPRTTGALFALDYLKQHLREAVRRPVIEGAPQQNCDGKDEDAKALTVHRVSPREVTVDLDQGAAGIVVLSDAYHPDWHAYVDGSLALVYRVNALMRGVFVPTGARTLRFVYEPPVALLFAMTGSAIAVVLAIGFMLMRGGAPGPGAGSRRDIAAVVE